MHWVSVLIGCIDRMYWWVVLMGYVAITCCCPFLRIADWQWISTAPRSTVIPPISWIFSRSSSGDTWYETGCCGGYWMHTISACGRRYWCSDSSQLIDRIRGWLSFFQTSNDIRICRWSTLRKRGRGLGIQTWSFSYTAAFSGRTVGTAGRGLTKDVGARVGSPGWAFSTHSERGKRGYGALVILFWGDAVGWLNEVWWSN